jgi:hypothetical protein
MNQSEYILLSPFLLFLNRTFVPKFCSENENCLNSENYWWKSSILIGQSSNQSESRIRKSFNVPCGRLSYRNIRNHGIVCAHESPETKIDLNDQFFYELIRIHDSFAVSTISKWKVCLEILQWKRKLFKLWKLMVKKLDSDWSKFQRIRIENPKKL